MQDKKPGMDPETVLATLNQVTQTIEVLSGVVARLQKYVQAHTPPPVTEKTVAVKETAVSEKKLLH